jgi:hypothetical protein
MTRNCILDSLGLHHLLAGELATAERLVDEGRLIANATGNLPVTYAAMLLTAWQGRVHEASELIQAAVQMATGSGRGMLACHRRDRPQARRPAARAAGASEALTAQEAQVARLARDGISSRGQLHRVLSAGPGRTRPS